LDPTIFTNKFDGEVIKMKNKWLSGLLSFVLPGLGQIYLGLKLRGILLIIAYAIAFLTLEIVIGIILIPIVWIFGIIDAIKKTDRMNGNN